MSLKFGQVTTIVVSSPNMAKEILQTHDQLLSDRAIPNSIEVHDHHKHSMTFLPISPLWRELKKICNNQLFSNKTLDETRKLRQQKLEEILNDIHQSSLNNEAVDIGKLAFKTSINLLSNTIFSLDLVHSNDAVGDFKELVMNIMKESGNPNIVDFFPVMKIFNLDIQGIYSRNAVYAGKIIDIFKDLIDQRLKLREVQGFDSNSDMLNTLLNIAQNNSKEMNRNQIQHLFLTLFVAGTETISSTIEWAMAELLKNEEVMSKAKQELEQIIGKNKLVEESDITRLPYLQAIIKETFRLHPPVPFLIPRKSNENVEICGYTIPKGAHVLVNVWAIGRNSSIWENVNLFSPFLTSEIDVKGHNFELTPFGAGKRICPALPIAMRMLYLILGSLINCFNWKFENGMKIDDMNMEDNFGITLTKVQPLRVIPEKTM
ncbi:geraniol 8-hydroxylase-like [Cicer arietinum]